MKKNTRLSLALVYTIIFLLILLTSIQIYTEWAQYTAGGITASVSSYSLWYNLFGGRWGQILCFMSPVLIAIASVTPFLIEIESGFFKDAVLRKGYGSYIRNRLFSSYIKALFIFPFIYLIAFFLLYFLFPSVLNTESTLSITAFAPLRGMQPILFVLTSILNVSLYSFVIVNISFIIAYFIKKPAIHFLVTFLSINFFNLVIGNIVPIFFSSFYGFDFYNGFICMDAIYLSLTTRLFLFYLFLTSLILYFLYKKREKVCDK